MQLNSSCHEKNTVLQLHGVFAGCRRGDAFQRGLSCVAWCLLSFQPVRAQELTLQFAYEDKDIPPHFMGDGVAIPERPGIVPEAVRMLESRVPGLKVQLKRIPWKRCLAELGEGKVDAIVASFHADRTGLGAYPMKDGQPDASLRFSRTRLYFYKLKTSPLAWDGTALKNLEGPVGAQFGYSVVADLQKKGIEVSTSYSALINFRNLAQKRLAAVAAHEDTGKSLLKRQEFVEIVAVEPPISSKDYYLVLSHQFVQRNPERAKRIWQAAAAIRDNELLAITQRYDQL